MTLPNKRYVRLLLAPLLIALNGIVVAQDSPTPKPLTVVELFQSQGCSSCPPAEANLNAIAGQPDILALSYGVTYWDSLGWKDTFATQGYTDRQYDYARYHHRSGVFTPQVYVDGQNDLVGSDRLQLNRVIAQSRKSGPPLTWSSGQLHIGSGTAAMPADVWLVRYDPRTILVAIAAGENGGRTLPHRNVVRELRHLGTWNGASESFALPAAGLPGLSTAALVQAPSGGEILSASKAAQAVLQTNLP